MLGWWNGRHVRLRGVCRKACGFKSRPEHHLQQVLLIQIVHFDEGDSSGVAYPADDGGVIARWQVCNNRGFVCRSGSVAAVLDVADLIGGDDSADYRRLPIII